MSKLLLSKSDEEYLEKCATEMDFAYGIIIGQRSEPGKHIVVHLAKNDEEDNDFPSTGEEEPANAMHATKNVQDINLQALTNQWLSACKMIPGSFNVLGLFVAAVSRDYANDNSNEFKNAKRLFYDMHNLLKQDRHFKTPTDDDTDYIYLSYSQAAKRAISKVYNYVANGGTFSPMECRFVEKPFEWHTFECNYELVDVFPIINANEKINMEEQFQSTIDSVRRNLNASQIFLQYESVDDDQTLETYIKRRNEEQQRKEQTSAAQPTSSETIKATIFLPVRCQTSRGKRAHIREFNGTIRLSGVISSRVWCNPKNTIGDVKRFIREDIMRSLMARIQVYSDGFTEPNISNDAIFISEPPRRVYFNVNSVGSMPVQFSEYIFKGETPTVAAAQAKQILDLDVVSDSIIADLEGVPEDETFSDASFEMMSQTQKYFDSNGPSSNYRELTKTMYMLGVTAALMVLLASIVVSYFVK